MSKNHELGFSCDLMLFGRGLQKEEQSDGSICYEPTRETIQCATEAGLFWQTYPEYVQQIISSGGYPLLAQNMPRPHDGTNEGTIMATHLKDAWNVTCEINVEPDSGHTFANISKSLEAGFLQPGKYHPYHRLGLVANEAHSARVILLVRFALNLDNNSLFRVRPLIPERNPEVIERERLLAKLTRIAITRTEEEGVFSAGTPGCVDRACEYFTNMWDEQEEHLRYFEAQHGESWAPDDVLVIDYHRRNV